MINDTSNKKGTILSVRNTLKTFAVICALFLSFTSFFGANRVYAHSESSSTYPADGSIVEEFPQYIDITFNKEVTITGASLLNAEGTSIPLNAETSGSADDAAKVSFAAPDDVAKGWYAVNWSATSTDGHAIVGTFTFYYGDPALVASAAKVETATSPTDPYIKIAALLRIFSYMAILVALGSLAAHWVTRGTLTKALPYTRYDKSLLVATCASILGMLVTPLLLVNTAIILNGGSFESLGLIVQIVASGPVGSSLLIRISALFGLCTALLLLSEKSLRKAGIALFALSSFAYIYSYAMGGHAYVVPWKWVSVVGVVLHLIGGALWLGGVPALLLTLRKLDKLDANTSSGDQVFTGSGAKLEIVERFSKIATIGVICVGIGGFLASFTMFKSLTEYYTTSYGRALLLKITLVALTGAMGAYNHYILVPALRKEPSSDALHNRLRTSLRKEGILLICIILATGFLTYNAAPQAGGSHLSGHASLTHGGSVDAGELASRLEPAIVRASVAVGEVQLEYYPGDVAVDNVFNVRLTDLNGLTIPIDSAYITFSNADAGITGFRRDMNMQSEGFPSLATRDLGIPGVWQIIITMNTINQDLVEVPMTIEISNKLEGEQKQ